MLAKPDTKNLIKKITTTFSVLVAPKIPPEVLPNASTNNTNNTTTQTTQKK
jgi:hypothetical protein